ncbi:hypothetical protein [Nocardia brevicatena]|uniref:hypothetical protein n=1 Tax=Nocardia brevicatena TaxID=37327 RepID=UPI0012FC222C|nr:hypothetical protein [Nocardia brevicatena]
MVSRLKTVLRERHLQTHGAFCREYDKVAATIDPDLVGSAPKRAQFHRWLSGDVKGLPYPHHCRVLEKMLPGHIAAQLFTPDTANQIINEPTMRSRDPGPSVAWASPRTKHRSHVDGPVSAGSQTLFGDHLSVLRMPTGRFFSGPDIPTIVFPATAKSGRVMAIPPTGAAWDLAMAAPGRSLVVAHIDAPDQPRHYVMDRRRARARLAAGSPNAPLLFPCAYLLDDFTFAIIWAVTCLDSALLDDDTNLADALALLDAPELAPYPAFGHDLGVDLSPVSRMWLGSEPRSTDAGRSWW